MSSCFYFVFTQPKAGQDEEFNTWYSQRHIFDLVAIPGIVAAQRYQLLDATTAEKTPDYLAIYEFSDVDLAIAGIAERRGTERMPSTEAINRDLSKGVVFRPLWAVDGDWRFGAGRLDLFKLDTSSDLVAPPPAPGVLLVNDKQSRPGPPVFDLAYFNRDQKSPAVRPSVAVSSLNVLMSPITERVAASA